MVWVALAMQVILVLVEGFYQLKGAVAKPARLLVMLCKYFCVHGPRKQSISKQMNNDNDLKFA